MVLYVIFSGCKKYQISAQNLKGLASDFTEKLLFVAKIERKSIFLAYEAHIMTMLVVMVLYIVFGFTDPWSFKNIKFCLKI
jgi:hypothetical protein